MESVVFNDFSGGWRGILDLAKTTPNMYDARNMLLYQDGSLGPRPGLKTFNLGRTTTSRVAGLQRVDWNPKQLVYVDGLTVYAVKDDQSGTGGSTAFTGALSQLSAGDIYQPMIPFQNNLLILLENPLDTLGGKIQTVDLFTGAVTAIASILGAFSGSFYGRRFVATNNRQIYYSNPIDPSIVFAPATNFIPVSVRGATLVFVSDQRNHLTIVTADGQWWVLTGVPGVNDTLRRVQGTNTQPPAIAPASFVDTGDDLIYYLSPVNNYPAYFDGAKHVELPYLSMTPEDPRASYVDSADIYASFRAVRAVQGADNGAPIFILTNPTNRMLTKHHGAWGLHEFSIPVGQSWTSDNRGRLWGFGPITVPNTPAYTTDLRLERPAFTSDTHAQPGDNSTTPVDAWVTFPEQWSDDGDLIRVTEVLVDFTRWNTGSASTNHITATVEAIARGSEAVDGTFTQQWDQPTASSPNTLAGQKDRVRFTFGSQGAGAGWRLKLSALRGVAIRNVIVNGEKVGGDGRPY